MANGQVLTEYTNFIASTGDAWVTGPQQRVNELVKHTYITPRIANGKSLADMVQGGKRFSDQIYLKDVGSYQRRNAGEKHTYENSQSGEVWSADWSFADFQITTNEKELDLNTANTTGEYRVQVYKSVYNNKRQQEWTHACNKYDDEWVATPNRQQMEDQDTGGLKRLPYSIPCAVNEITGGLYTDAQLGAGNGWSTYQGLNPALYPDPTDPTGTRSLWDNWRVGYDFSTGNTTEIFASMSYLFHQLRFHRLPKMPQYSDKTTSPHVILTQLQGLTNYEHALRVNQDEFRGMGTLSGQDPHYNGPTFRGVPIDRADALETALIFPTGTGGAVSHYADTSNNTTYYDGPRYFFLNGEYFNAAAHSDHNWRMGAPKVLEAQPDTVVQNIDHWDQRLCRSRHRQGMLFPRQSIGSIVVAA